MLQALRQHAHRLKRETYALYLVAHHPDTPWYAKAFVAAVVAYAFSPVDLIPDFIPVLGYLDDLVLIPAGIALAVRLTPPHVMSECRTRAADVMDASKPVSRGAAVAIVTAWVVLAALLALWFAELSGAWRHA